MVVPAALAEECNRTGADVVVAVVLGYELIGRISACYRIKDSCSFTRRDVSTVYRLAVSGKIQPVIHAKLRLKEAAEAHRILEERRQFGKVLLIPEA